MHERRARAEQAQRDFDLRKKGFVVDVYGGLHAITPKVKRQSKDEVEPAEEELGLDAAAGAADPCAVTQTREGGGKKRRRDTERRRKEAGEEELAAQQSGEQTWGERWSMGDSADQGKRGRRRANDIVTSDFSENIPKSIQKVEYTSGGSGARNRKERRQSHREAASGTEAEVSVHGRRKVFIKGPTPGEGQAGSSSLRSRNPNSDGGAKAVHPSWAAKQKLKEKQMQAGALKIDIKQNKPLGKKITFDD